MLHPLRLPWRALWKGGALGALTWAIYSVVEFGFYSVIPSLRFGYPAGDWHWKWSGILFVTYLLWGSLLGGLLVLIASCQRTFHALITDERGVTRTGGLIITATLLLPHIVVSAVPSLRDPSSSHFFVFLWPWIALALGVSLASENWHRKFALFLTPWTLSVVLIGGPALSESTDWEDFDYLPLMGSVAFVAAVTAGAILLGRRFPPRDLHPKPIRTALLSAMIGLGLLTTLIVRIERSDPLFFSIHASSPPTERPSVVLIVMDTVRADHLSLYGYERETSPFLKKFAEHATLFLRHTSTGDMTLSSHASIFTGLYPSWHGAHYAPPHHAHGRPLAPRFQTLAELLSSSGYLTAGVVANYTYLSPSFGLSQGFHFYDCRRPLVVRGPDRHARHLARHALIRLVPTADFDKRFWDADHVNATVFRFLHAVANQTTPFFLFINYMDAHTPYLPRPPYQSLFSGKDSTYTFDRYQNLFLKMNLFAKPLPQKDRAHLVSQYDGAIAYLDSRIHRVLEQLKRLGLYDNTLVIITSDHGEAFGRRNLLQHSVSVYEDQTHVPLIVKYPRQHHSNRVSTSTSGVDLFPTILNTLRLPLPAGLHGISLRRLEPPGERTIISESFPHYLPSARLRRTQRAVLKWPYKLIVSTNTPPEGYNLFQDPGETTDVYAPNGSFVPLKVFLDRYLAALPAHRHVFPSLDRETIDRLRSLGYVQ